MRPKPTRLLDHREYPVLYVDDEVDNLRIFELTFRRDFTILTAQSAKEGLEILSQHPVAVVLSDQKMPGVEGVEFLRRVRELDSRAVRILVTAYGDAQILGDAINDGNIYRYLAKPWEPEDMRLTVQRAIEAYALESERATLLEELMILNRLSRTIHRDIDQGHLHDTLLAALSDELNFDGCAILLCEADSATLRFAAAEPDDDVAERLRQIRIDEESAPIFLDQLCKGDSQLLEGDASMDLEPPIRKWVTEVSAEEVFVVPLIGKERVIGALAVDNRRGGPRLGTDGRMLVEGLAMQAVIAIENAQLVDDLRRSRAQVRRVDRLGTLGTLAAGLAHEINNPLVSINTFLSLAPEKRETDDPSFWDEYHELACAELERIRGLVETMSRLGRAGPSPSLAREIVDVGEVARQVVRLLHREAERAGVRVDLRVDETLPGIEGVRDQIHQVVLNLTLNAIQASPTGGTISIGVEADGPAGDPVGIRIRFRDSGDGISEENLERIFDPFFTTKDPDKGTGLGLMISHQIVADHGGSIEVESTPGAGATFHVRLPLEGPVGRAEGGPSGPAMLDA
ncbi:MAG TPA: response regulator [Deltaproteobacteria bacterium]|nr:response regulator [Deltaproteobacteria bacterium]